MNLKRTLVATAFSLLTIISTFSCSSTSSVENNLLASNVSTLSTKYVPKHKYTKKLDPNKPKITYDLPPLNGSIKKVDLRKFSSTPVNQGELGSCTGFSIAKGLREYMLRKDNKDNTALSPLFLYYNERKKEGSIDEDAGAIIETGMRVLQEMGVSSESLWPYDESKFKIEPSLLAYQDAKKYKVKTIRKLKSLSAIKKALNEGNPVVFGIEVYQSFEEPPNGMVPIPNTKTEEDLGGHAVSCFGYDDAKSVFIMKNSWGEEWGDKGYFYLPYQFFKLKLAEDAWTAENR